MKSSRPQAAPKAATLKNHGRWSPRASGILHGGDYNPDQWQDQPKVQAEDLRLMRMTNFKLLTVNVFGWSACEPREGRFSFGWLDRTLDGLAGIGARVLLATPSGSKPAWLSARYPEVRRVSRAGLREPHRERHNHCFSSPVFRQKAADMAARLARRYGKHPALAGWHVGNEVNGECHCELCQRAFQRWLKAKYGSLQRLNAAWWNGFWSHTLSDWREARSEDDLNPGLQLDWWRFSSDNLIASLRAEIEPLRRLSPGVPVTTNFLNPGVPPAPDYWKLAQLLDVASWDAYPGWDLKDNAHEASGTALAHDIARSYKGGKPFLLMESSPEAVNWRESNRLPSPGLARAGSLMAVAHGSDTVQYFQWRKGRGGFEQFHGAVVDHAGGARTRVFREVAGLGAELAKLDSVAGCGVRAQAALLWDWDVRTAYRLSPGMQMRHKDADGDARAHYRELWKRGVAVDAVSLRHRLDGYRLLLAPCLYMVTPEFAQELQRWVREGGTVVTGWLAGTVDEHGLCHLGGRPGLLRELFGVWAEELDALPDGAPLQVKAAPGNEAGLRGRYSARHFADLLHLEGARALASYQGPWYTGRPAATEHRYGKGRAIYIGSRNETRFLSHLYGAVLGRLRLPTAARALPLGVDASVREDGRWRHLFLSSFRDKPCRVGLHPGAWEDLLSGRTQRGSIALPALGCAVLRQPV